MLKLTVNKGAVTINTANTAKYSLKGWNGANIVQTILTFWQIIFLLQIHS